MAAGADRTPAALVIGLDSVTGLQTARTLARRGIPVAGLARHRGHMACRTNVCRDIAFCETSGEGLLGALETLGSSFAVAPVLFPCTDLAVLAVSAGRNRLLSRYRAVLPPPGVIETLLDKATFHAHALGAGLPVSPTRLLRNRFDAKAAAETLRFPCVLKPGVKTVLWQSRTSAKLYKVTTAAELMARYDECSAWTDVLIAQEWIDGPAAHQFTCNAYFDARSIPRLTFVSQKLREWPLEGGVGCFSRECRNDDVLRTTIEVFRGVGHHGLAYLEMKLDPRTGNHVIIEPNVGRPTGRSAAADATGVDLLYTHYCDALGLPLPLPREQVHGPRKWIYLRQDCQSAYAQWRRGRLSLSDWLRSLRGCRGDAVFSWTDPRPFVTDLMHAVRKASTHPVQGRQGQSARSGWRAATRGEARPAEGPIDHDIHGLVGVRLLGASREDAAAVARQLGAPRRPLTREADIIVRFVDQLSIDGLRWIEFGRTGFTDDGFFVLQKGRRPAAAKVPFEHVGGCCEIVCQRGARSVPLLLAIVNMTAFARGGVPLHASAFRHRGSGVLVTGWAKGGKTEALLAFARHGAEYIGDEWIILSDDGRTMHGIPEFIRLQDWHLSQLPHVRDAVPATKRAFFTTVRLLDRLHGYISGGRLAHRFPFRLADRAMPAMTRQLNVQLDPLRVFGAGPHSCSAVPTTVFLMMSHDDRCVRVDPVDTCEVASRMAASVCYEQLPLLSTYEAYRFAFPDRRNELLDGFSAALTERLARALAGKQSYSVRHPYPCRLEALFEAMAPLCGGQDDTMAAPRIPGRMEKANATSTTPLLAPVATAGSAADGNA